MKIIENDIVKEKLYIKKLENGLTVMIMPKKGTTKQYIIFGTNYGSIDSEFIVPGTEEQIKVPDGVAHFLEHKLFEQENGKNSLDVLSALGVSANAYTTNDHTAYLFESTDNFYEALDEFMDYIQHPYFTDENVEKEKGIIGQEIMMYDDYPMWKVYLNALKSLYKNNPINIDITGTKESISKIDKETLYKCYNTFYHPSNMAIMICGDFEPENIIKEIEKRLVKKETQTEIKRIYPDEPEQIVRDYFEEKMEVSIPLFIIGIKDEVVEQKEKVKRHIAVEILLELLLGKSSELYKKLYNEDLLQGEANLGYEYAKNYAHIIIEANSKDPKKVMELFKQEVASMKEKGLSEEDFQRIKKVIYSSYIKQYNSVSEISNMFLSDYFKGINSFDYLEEYNTVDLNYIKQVLDTTFKEENMTLSVIGINNSKE